MKKQILLLCLALISLCGYAQQITVKGVVTSATDQQPLIGTTVQVKGTGTGTITGIDGDYTLPNVDKNAVLVFSSIGFESQEIAVGGRTTINVVLKEAAELLDEVVVIGYGAVKKSDLTSSIATVKGDEITETVTGNAMDALQGKVNGVQVTSGGGPGATPKVLIRGVTTVNGTNPLYVVDGVPYDGNISAINPNDIETMTVLKDASAGALYGSRGANGVIMITTKKGNSGKVKVNLKANWGVSSRAIPRYETMDEAGYLETIFQSYKNNQIINGGVSPELAGVAALEAMKSGSTAMLGQNEQYNPFNYSITELIDPVTGKVRSDAKLRYSEDWMDEALKSNPLRQEYVASFSGGSDKTKYMFSLGYLDEEGLLKTTKFNRYNGRLNIDSEVTNWLKAGMSANYSRNESNTAVENSSGSSNVWYSAQLMAPIFPVFEKDANGATIYDNLGNAVFDYGKNRPAGASSEWNTIATL